MALSSEISHQNGKLWIVFGEGDADGDGLSDYDEQMVNGSPDYEPLSGDTSVTNPDSDGDDMKDGWEFVNGLNPLLNDADMDADQDGHDNISEYIAGMNPNDSESVFSITYFDPSAGYVVEWPSVTDRLYNVYWSTNLAIGFSAVTNDLEHPINSYTDTLHGAEPEGFYKVDVRLKP